jgi:AmmeMemoRadiSam system protein B
VLIRDPYRYSDRILIVPPALVPLLALFDGRGTEADLRQALVSLTGQLVVGDLMRHLLDSLSTGGFLEDEVSVRLQEEGRQRFAAAERREAVHAGGAYPAEADALTGLLRERLEAAPASAVDTQGLLGIAAPHVSPEGGWSGYTTAYGLLTPELADRTFVVLGTSHYGEPERFGLTRKPFLTPLGETGVAADLVAALEDEGGPAVQREDYCHAVEHSIEFQVVFLQHLYGPGVRVVPILCGAFLQGLEPGRRPEDDDGVARFLEVLGRMAARDRERLVWVLGVDMAHLGRRYGDELPARPGIGRMRAAARRDRERIDRIAAGDAAGFWSLVQPDGDDLRWCGSSPLYTFLAAVRPGRGSLLDYGQWAIDEESVVSFASLAFFANGATSPSGS